MAVRRKSGTKRRAKKSASLATIKKTVRKLNRVLGIHAPKKRAKRGASPKRKTKGRAKRRTR